jgi:hypothetical protein
MDSRSDPVYKVFVLSCSLSLTYHASSSIQNQSPVDGPRLRLFDHLETQVDDLRAGIGQFVTFVKRPMNDANIDEC